MEKKFLHLVESIVQRLQRGGALVGDLVKIVPDYKNTEEYKDLHDSIKQHIETLANSDINIKIVNIKNKNLGNYYPGAEHSMTGDVELHLALDYGGGRYVEICPVPPALVEVQTTYPNLDPIPDAIKRPNQVTIKPEPVSSSDENYEEERLKQQEMADKGNGLQKTDHDLMNKNVKIPSSPAEGDPKPEVSYTQMYLPSNA